MACENVFEEKHASQAECTSPKWARHYAEPGSISNQHPWGTQGPPAIERGLTGAPSVSAFHKVLLFFWVGELFITMIAMKVTTRAVFSSSDDEQQAT